MQFPVPEHTDVKKRRRVLKARWNRIKLKKKHLLYLPIPEEERMQSA